ncbi:MAG: hypothetical protein ACYCYA_01695 [Actinomycetes bacterium]
MATLVVLLVVAVVTIGVQALVSPGDGGLVLQAATTSPGGRYVCSPDLPPQKCAYRIAHPNFRQDNPLLQPRPAYTPAPGGPNMPISTAQANGCATSTALGSELQADFGMITCYRFAGHRTLVIIGDGTPQVSSPPPVIVDGHAMAAYGAMIAVLRCPVGDAACRRGTITRAEFADFHVTYLGRAEWGLLWQTSFAERYLDLAVAAVDYSACGGQVFFDIRTLTWYPAFSLPVRQAIVAGQSPPEGVRGPVVSGTRALAGPPPTSLPACTVVGQSTAGS